MPPKANTGARSADSDADSNTPDVEYEVIRKHTWEDPRTLDVTKFKVGDDYTGDDVEYCLVGDGNGPLIRKKTRAADTPAAPASDIKEN